MRHLVIFILALAIVSCTGQRQQGNTEINNGRDFLCNAGICDDSLNLKSNNISYDNDGETLPHMILDMDIIQAIGLDKVMYVDTVDAFVNVWGVKDYPDKGITLLMGHTTYPDMRTGWLATYGKQGLIDFMRLGECGGTVNLSYWDDVDEHTRDMGNDSMRMVVPNAFGKPINISRWITYCEQRDGVETDSTLWFIDNELSVTINNDGNFILGKIGTVYSADSTIITPYWRYKRQLEVLSWTPLSDTTFCDKVNTLLDEARGHITNPSQLQGDFFMLTNTRLDGNPQRLLTWCCDHPDSQLTRGIIEQLKDVSPEYINSLLNKIDDPAIRTRAGKLLRQK